MLFRSVSQIAFCSGVRLDVPQEEDSNQNSELKLSEVRYRKQRRADSRLSARSSSIGRVVLGVLCVDPRITSYALDRSFSYVARRSSHRTDEAVLCPILQQA